MKDKFSLEQALEKRNHELSTLARSQQLITSSLNLKEVLVFIVEACANLMKVPACHIRLLNENNELVFAAASGVYKDSQQEFRKLKIGESLSGWIVARGEPLIVEDVTLDGRNVHAHIAKKHGLKSFLGVPLKIRDKVIGVLGMIADQTRLFSEEEIQLVSSFANQAAIAIENARLYEESREKAKQLALIYDLTNKIRSSLDLEIIIYQTLTNLKDLVNYDHAGITLIDESGENIIVKSPVREGSKSTPPPEIVFPLKGSALEWMLTSRQAHIQKDLRKNQVFLPDQTLLSWGVRSVVRVPLMVKDKVLGLLFLNSYQPNYYEEKVLDVLYQIAGQLAMAIENARLFEESEKRRREAEASKYHLEVAIQAAQQSEEKFRQIAENIGEVFWMTSPDKSQMIYVSPAYERIWGRTCKSLYEQPRSWIDAIHPEDRERIRAALEKQIRGEYDEEYRILQPDGSIRWIRDRAFPVRNGLGEVYRIAGIATDITDRKKMEAELLKAQKLESIGVLAGGIAHDFNNILTAILLNISLAKMKVDPEGEIFKNLDEAEKASLRAKDLTQQLLTFSKGGAPIKKTASIAELVKDSANFALRGSNVRCEFSIPEDLWLVEVDKGQMSQVIHNLILNAQQAMPEGGIIKVTAENKMVGVEGEQELPLPMGPYIKLSIQDEGTGIPAEHLPKIFDPYFTTKQKGSGLGLATTYSIIKRHGGYIGVESKLGVGTTFSIYLPASRKEIPLPKDSMEAGIEVNPQMSKKRILIMDDEEILREATSQILEQMGYEVALSRDGVEAIELYKKAMESHQPFEVVIMDLTIPGGMGGKETLRRLLEINPQVKAIVSSGYSNDPIMAEYKQYGFSGVISKPYKIEELSQTLRKVILDTNK
ncbi:MAG TPA: GAF domain-containing protein [Candidatus Limnocylindrales bacterium]|nr:GAF domain-containing protein [Candidatus Limnocylindrales bacterium]